MHIIVVGSGILGSLTALLASRRGARVTLLEERDELWTEASLVNEGKVHLGPVFALGDAATHEVMLRGALAFAPVVERALGGAPDWRRWATDEFDYLVMPDSLARPDELVPRYRAMNELATQLPAADRANYLGAPLERIMHLTSQPWQGSDITAFHSAERAVDPILLRAAVVEAIDADPRIEVLTGTRATVLGTDADRGTVRIERDDAVETVTADAVVNAAWRQQAALLPVERPQWNFRIKAAARIELPPGLPTVTLVQGPYGDVVPHHDYAYVSWYPEARLSNEHGTEPSTDALTAADAYCADPASAPRQLGALHRLGLLPAPETIAVREVVAGVIIGHGPLDIHDRRSGLHTRSQFGVRTDGRVVTPLTFKLTTAPLAAAQTVDAIAAHWGGLA